MKPPRIPVLLSRDKPVVYFLTICVEGRIRCLDREKAWQLVLENLTKLDRWSFPLVLAMPDHLHCVAMPVANRDEDLSMMLMWFKRWCHQSGDCDWKWQGGGFDRLLRSDESLAEKVHYVRMNPVRAKLVEYADEWPWCRMDPEWR